MAKRVDQDATQELSASQLVVPPAKPPVYGNVPKNDASMWMQTPVSADDFIGVPAKKPNAPGSGGRGILIGVILVALVAMTAGGVWYAYLRETPKQTSAFETKPATPAPAPATPAVAQTTDAGVATAAADAAVALTGDAGAPAAVGGLQADAVTAADPAPKKPTKKRTTKKKTTKKKTATAPKKRR
jgi:hypothetical protein